MQPEDIDLKGKSATQKMKSLQASLSQNFMRNEEKTKAAEHEPCCYLASKQASWRQNRRA
jgi:hypothetical protein